MLARARKRRFGRRKKVAPPALQQLPVYPPEAQKDYPGLVAQAVIGGFRVDFIDDSKLLEGPYHYNAGMVEEYGELWLAYRDQDEKKSSRIAICRLDGDDLVPRPSHVMDLPQHFPRSGCTEQAEDPRLFWFRDSLWMSYCAWDRQGVAGQAIVELGGNINDRFAVSREVRTDYCNNMSAGRWQKNWAFFDCKGDLRMIYAPGPVHEVVSLSIVPKLIGSSDDLVNIMEGKGTQVGAERGIEWAYGLARGGTPPVLHDGLYWSFFHSRLMTPKGRFRYFMGAYAFGAREPHRPEVMTPEPILGASDRDKNRRDMPFVVFPCGAVMRSGTWWVSLGSNDCQVAIVRIEHEWLRKKVVACP